MTVVATQLRALAAIADGALAEHATIGDFAAAVAAPPMVQLAVVAALPSWRREAMCDRLARERTEARR